MAPAVDELSVQLSKQPPRHTKGPHAHKTDIPVIRPDPEKPSGKDIPPRTIGSKSSIPVGPSQKSQREPTHLSFFSAKLIAKVPVVDIGDLVGSDGSPKALLDKGPTDAGWWLDVVNPTEGEIDILVNAFSIHPLTEEDLKMREPRERIELFKHYYYMCFHSFYRSPNGDDYRSFGVHVIVFHQGVLSFTFSKQSRHAANVQTRMGRLRDYVTFTSGWICYAIIDDIIDSFASRIVEIDRESSSLEDDVSLRGAADSDSLLMQIHICRQKVMSTIRLLKGKVGIIKRLTKGCSQVGPRDDIKLYLDDILDHAETMISNLNHFDEILLRSRFSYLAQISVDQIDAKQKIFRTMSKCAAIGAILVSLNVICAAFGMNVWVPGQFSEGVWWWMGIAGVIVVGKLVTAALARQKKLL
ncbi:Mg(2+) transporter [Orbilia ellipsospora]|uniref:Mg(2+) transporter n=1 Tax=Orbilia ellipsospora TaxID=2528407 RepID=A0AAV9WYA3_9PEZI